MDYQNFLREKQIKIVATGIEVSKKDINNSLFDFQKDIVRWALAKGKAAIFAGTGLGKTAMQLEWARHIPGDVLILAPLAVSSQTVREGKKFNISVNYCKDDTDIKQGINITNYERLEKFDLSRFTGIVLDESSILKAQTGKTRTAIIELCEHIPYKLACTATPAPNDHMELGNHAEFLGVMKSTEMLSTFFVHDGGDTSKWRLKGHAVKKFWEWVASWAVMLTNPSDLGYENSKFELPPLNINQHTVKTNNTMGTLFTVEALTLKERQAARRNSIEERAQKCAELVNNSAEQWLVWCNLNSEADALKKAIPDAVEVRGSDSPEHKEQSAIDFANGKIRILISKPSIFGFGLNWQNCRNMAFVGLSDSFEEYYQAVRRCWRFGQTKSVNVHVITADTEGAVVENIKRKERDFNVMLSGMISATQEITKQNITGTVRQTDEYNPQKQMKLPEWLGGIAC